MFFHKRKHFGFKATSKQTGLDMIWLYCANNCTECLGAMTKRSCTSHSTFSNELCCSSCCWGHLISATSHGIQCTLLFFSIDTLLSVSHWLSLPSLLVSLCVLVLEPFVCFHFIVNSVPLNLSVLQSGPMQVHRTLYQHLFLSVASGMGIVRADGALFHES